MLCCAELYCTEWNCIFSHLVRSTPSKMKSYGFTKYYYTGDASKPSTQAEIKKNFKALLNEPYSQDSFCKNNALCTDNNIEILYDKGTGKKIVTTLTCFQRNHCRKNIVKKWHEVLFDTCALLVNSLLKCRHKTISVFSITKNEFGKAGRV